MLKAAVVGTGYLGRFHAEKYAASEIAELVAVYDVDHTRASEVAAKLDCKAVSDLRELKSMGVNCASVATTTSTHYDVAKQLLESDIDVLLEKPMTRTVSEARELLAIATQRGRRLQIGHLERFNPAYRAIRELVNSPRFFEVRRVAPFSGRSQDVDVILDLMIHDLDILLQIVNSEVERIDAVGVPVLTSSFDIANVRLVFQNGAVANITASRAAFQAERTLRIFQPDLYISLNFEKRKYKAYQRNASTPDAGAPLPGLYQNISVTEYDSEPRDALKDQIESFLLAVRDRGPVEVPAEHGIRALSLAHDIREEMFRTLERFEHTGTPMTELKVNG